MKRNNLCSALYLLLATLHFAQWTPAQNSSGRQIDHPVLFVTQVPIPADFTTIGSVFGNHRATMRAVGRGGDLWIRYPDGSLKNLTAAAGYGHEGFQGDDAIAVRDPSVHWDGEKAVFSMVVGAPGRQYEYESYFWQMYEIRGLLPGDQPVITKVPNQPLNRNNISPIYGTNDRIIFTSDETITREEHLYPQLDEYEEAPTVSGIWSLDPASGDLFLMVHAPSGDFRPRIDSYGRVIFTQWDHLQRDQQADADSSGYGNYGTFNWSAEGPEGVPLDSRVELYPEPRPARQDLLAGTNLEGHRFNHFFPWMVREDGRDLETLNHIGRHELHSYFNRSMNDDPNLQEFISSVSGRDNPNAILNFLHVEENPAHPGQYFGIDAPEFQTHSAGQIIAMDAPLKGNPDRFQISYITHRDTSGVSTNPGSEHSGLYREALPLQNGTLIAVHTAETRADENVGSRSHPISLYDFRLKTIELQGSYYEAASQLTPGIQKSIQYWDPDVLVSYSGELWELNPVEVRPRQRPQLAASRLEDPEIQAFESAGVHPRKLRTWLKQNGLALVVSRNVTTRDQNDRQQPYNLRVSGTATQTIGSSGKIYDVSYMQFFQAEQIRGIGGPVDPKPGRRVLAQPMPIDEIGNPPLAFGPEGGVTIATDGSMAAFVPARRALTWQLTDAGGIGVVRERYWLSFQPGEIRTCASCHGLNSADQANQSAPMQTPAALVDLLKEWRVSQN